MRLAPLHRADQSKPLRRSRLRHPEDACYFYLPATFSPGGMGRR